jgi:hypothetical protein
LGYRRMCFRRGRQYSEDADLLVGVFPSFSFGALTPSMALIDSIVWLATRGIREFDPPGGAQHVPFFIGTKDRENDGPTGSKTIGLACAMFLY